MTEQQTTPSGDNSSVTPQGDGGEVTQTTEPQSQEPTSSPENISVKDNGIIEHDGREYILKDSFKAVSDKYKANKEKVEEYEKAKEEKDNERLLNEKKYDELIAKKDNKLNEYKNKVETQTKINSIQSIGAKLGANDVGDLTNLLDLNSFEIDESGKVNTDQVEKALNNLKEVKPYLFGQAQTVNIGSDGGSPAKQGQQESIKLSDFMDQDFRKANPEIIDKVRSNQITVIRDVD